MQLPPLNPPALLQFLVTVLLVASSLLFILRTAASRYFAVDDAFESENHVYSELRHRQSMSIGRRGEDGDSQSGSNSGTEPGKCVSCGKPGSKVCSRCKSVRYCSQSCQSKHWREDHKFVCRKKEFSSANALTSGHNALKVLFPYNEFVRLYNWNKHIFPPCGLLNCGNSCFANVVLQCLACTRPLVAYLLEGTHSRECRRNSWCFLCELQLHIQRVTRNVQPFSPTNILSQLPNISSNLGYGRQEDAHEFMRFVIDTMQSVCLDEHGGEKTLAPITQETTLIQHIFGGHLQSQVICTNCNKTSNRYENMMDLTVEIQGDAESLENCLNQFTVKEWLDGENMYKCDGCDDYVKAWKRLTVHQAPNILTIALKRFQSGRFGKLNKRVTFPETLELSPYMSNAGKESNIYKLFAVVVHLDMLNASFFGHYICYTKDFSGNWYMIDDCKVIKVELEEVLSQGAYMLLYSRLNVRQHKPLEVAKESVPQKHPSDVDVSSISKSHPSDIANGEVQFIKCNGDTEIVETMKMNVGGFAHMELNKERIDCTDKYSSSKTETMDVDTNSSSREYNLEEVGSPNVDDINLEIHRLPCSRESTVHDILNELNQQNCTTAEQNFTSKADPLERDANGNFNEASSLEQNASLNSFDVKVKGPLYNGETTEISQVPPVSSSFMLEASAAEGNISQSNSSKAERAGFLESPAQGFKTADATSSNQKAKNSVVPTIASNSKTTPKSEKKVLFARGFLDKPLKKKFVSQVRDKMKEMPIRSVEKEVNSRERADPAYAASLEESKFCVLSDSAKDHAENVNLSTEENGQIENETESFGMDDILNGYPEPSSVCQILSEDPIQGNGRVSNGASDHPVCINYPFPEANGTSVQVDVRDESADCMVEMPADLKQSPHLVAQGVEYARSGSEGFTNGHQYVSHAFLNEPSELNHKMNPDGKCNMIEDDFSGKASENCYQASGVVL